MFSVTRISEIFDDITLSTIPMITDPLSILSPNNEDKRISIFKAIFRNTLREFSEYSPLILSNTIQVNNSEYTFKDQSNMYFNIVYNNQDEPQLNPDIEIELVPKTIARISMSQFSKRLIRAGVWKYNYPTLYIASGRDRRAHV